jgi:transcriptional regulator of acetoin/glycerol metabolism
LAQGGPAFITGGEHFADTLTGMACAGVPVTDYRTGQVAGVIDVTTLVARADVLMLLFAKHIAWEIEQRLLDETSSSERLMQEAFQSAHRRAKGPLALVSEFTMMTNPAAAHLLEPTDQHGLWEWASRASVELFVQRTSYSRMAGLSRALRAGPRRPLPGWRRPLLASRRPLRPTGWRYSKLPLRSSNHRLAQPDRERSRRRRSRRRRLDQS